MPFTTPHYGLEAHLEGERYSSSVEYRRWPIIDSQMEFLSSVVGDGYISGWAVTVDDLSLLKIKVSAGIGLINTFATYTYGSFYVYLEDNSIAYLYMSRKNGIIGGFSGFSDYRTITVTDTTPPAAPVGLVVTPNTTSNVLNWTANTEADLASYNIYSSLNNINYSLVASGVTGTTFINTNLTQNTSYYYKLAAVDLSKNASSQSSAVLGKTLKDLQQPLPVGGLQAFARDSGVQLYWNVSSSADVANYSIVAQALDTSYNVLYVATTLTVDPSKNFVLVPGLMNGIKYRLTVYAVNPNGIASNGVSVVTTPLVETGPAEVKDFEITYSPGTNSTVSVIMNVCVTPNDDPYVDHPVRYIATLIENGTTTSQPILFADGETCREIQLVPYTDANGNTIYNPLDQQTRYAVRIQGIDASGVINNGIFSLTEVPTFAQPPPPSNVTITQKNDNSLFVSWQNPAIPIFNYTLLTVKLSNAVANTNSTLLSNVNIGSSNTYIIPSKYAQPNQLISVTLQAVDAFGNESITANSSFQVPSPASVDRPDVPTGQTIVAGDKQVTISWDAEDPNQIQSYSILRADFTFFPSPQGFARIATLPSSYTQFVDYDVENGSSYIYFVTAINFYGLESENPITDGFSTMVIQPASPIANPNFQPPADLTVTQSGFDSVLNWNVSAGAFDGYQIWRSIGNNYSFQLIDNVSAGTTTYTDSNILLISGSEYFYMVRKFTNEATVTLTKTSAPPQGSILLAEITTQSGHITIDQSMASNLSGLLALVKAETDAQLAIHHHAIDAFGNDRRIDLSANIFVGPSDWTTTDYQTYTTTADIDGANAYVVNLNGTVNTAFFTDEYGGVNQQAVTLLTAGIPPFLYQVNGTTGTLSFPYPLYATQKGVNAPFSNAPQITLTLVGVQEVQNVLTEDRIESLSATQVNTGLINTAQLPSFNHEGRIGEPLLPVGSTLTSTDQFTWTFSDGSVLPNAVTFYDVMFITGNMLIAATSRGIELSTDYGATWKVELVTPTAPNKLFYAEAIGYYLALTSNGVYASQGTLTSWVLLGGTQNTKVIRDIVADASGNLYISTDLGVYTLVAVTANEFLTWQQTSLFGPKSTEGYAMLYDTVQSRVIVSNEIGILQTFDQGSSWTFTNELSDLVKLYSFVQATNGNIFVLTNNKIYRKTTGNFVAIALLNCQLARIMVIYQDRLFVTTDTGVWATNPGDDIYTSDNLILQPTFPEVNINGNTVPATSMNVVNGQIFLGTDYSLFIRTGDSVALQYQDTSANAPSVYVNGIFQLLGYKYDVSTSSISFDEVIGVADTVVCAFNYNNYTLPNGGWVYDGYALEVQVVLNGNIIADTNSISGGITLDPTQFSGFQFPTYVEQYGLINAYVVGAAAYQTQAETAIANLVSYITPATSGTLTALPAGQTLSSVVVEVYTLLEEFLSQLYPSARVLQTTSSTGATTTVPLELPAITVTVGTTVSFNVVDGSFAFSKQYGKYDNLSANIIGSEIYNIGQNTHSQIEDAFEIINSGLPSRLSQIQQSNLVKMGLFIERNWPGEQKKLSTPYQAVYNVPLNRSWYDVLNSTIDYRLVASNSSIVPSLAQASTAIYMPMTDAILVGGPNGIFSISNSTLDIKPVQVGKEVYPQIKQLVQNNGTVYLITDYNIYSSVDFGNTWTVYNRLGLPNRLFSIVSTTNALIVGAEDGIYYFINSTIGWTKAQNSNTPVELFFYPDILFALVDGTIYFSNDGSYWAASGGVQSEQINSLVKFQGFVFAATDTGLYKDDGTFYSNSATLSLVTILDNTTDSSNVIINDVGSGTDYLIAGDSEGTFYVYDGNQTTVIGGLPLLTIQKILVINQRVWLFGYDLFVMIDLVATGHTDNGESVAAIGSVFHLTDGGIAQSVFDYPIKLTTGAPL